MEIFNFNSSTLNFPASIFSLKIADITSFIPLLIGIFCFLLFLSKLLQIQFNEKPNQSPLPPGPKPWPLIGNLPEMIQKKPTFLWIHNLMQEMNTDIACIRIGTNNVIIVTCPEIGRQFLRKQDAVFASRPICMSAEVMSKHFSSFGVQPLGDSWKDMRKVISSHVLSPAKHQWLTGKREEEADNYLVHYLYKQCGGSNNTGLVKVRKIAQHYCGNLLRKIIFNRRYFGEGMEDGGPGVEEEEHVNSLFKILSCIYAFSVSDYVPWLRRFDIDGQEKLMREGVNTVGKYHDPIIEERIQQWKNGTKTEEEDLLDVFINLKDADGNAFLSMDGIKAQITEFMIGAIDNPSNAIEWTLAEMLNQPEIMAKAEEELDKVVGKDRLVQEHDIPKLNFIKACAREAFRLHPLSPFNIPHLSVSDTTVAGYFIPKGSRVLLSRIALGRNPKSWDEPLKYKPERHLNNDGSEVVLTEPELRFISFSAGRRGCPGVALGTSMTVMLFARLLHGFSWSLPPDQDKVDLNIAGDQLFLARPLVALAKPRLPEKLYIK
ncbi:hypothetical protein SLA2020_481040 [Shorea laevis]